MDINLNAALEDTPDARPLVESEPSTVRILTNPYYGTLTINIEEWPEERAAEIVVKLRGDFPQSLYYQWSKTGKLSPTQYYWFFKLAMENTPREPVQLLSNLQEFCSKANTIQFRIESIGKVMLRTQSDCVQVISGFYRPVGEIRGDKFFPSQSCSKLIIAQLLAMSANPMLWLENYGKETGRCAVCGLELTNEDSVARGIGPICAEKFS